MVCVWCGGERSARLDPGTATRRPPEHLTSCCCLPRGHSILGEAAEQSRSVYLKCVQTSAFYKTAYYDNEEDYRTFHYLGNQMKVKRQQAEAA